MKNKNSFKVKSLEEYFLSYNDNSWLNHLLPDPETDKYKPNKKSREVLSGHYILVKTTPMANPFLISYSTILMKELGLSNSIMQSDEMIKFLSGYSINKPTWSTPYALSIYGQEMYSNCPFNTGNGYGDGRLHSIGEFVINGKRWEFQLKGSGTTPFSRSGDGRSVLRSSVREYIVSEAMHCLGVPTTRALSLIVSSSEKVYRAWYSKPNSSKNSCSIKKNTCDQNETMELNPIAIVCRVSPSFLRVGHLELFGRRARNGKKSEIYQLELIFRHMLFREYPELLNLSLENSIIAVLKQFTIKLSVLISHWLRVGFVQSNFNSDNCLVSGRTMDYGPFGFLEKYDPNKNFWTGGGQHFSFMNQPNAAKMNFYSFANSLKPLVNQNKLYEIDNLIDNFDKISEKIINEMWAQKLGLITINWFDGPKQLFERLLLLMEQTDVDYTIFWRQLTEFPNSNMQIEQMKKAFYNKNLNGEWINWFHDYNNLLKLENRNPHIISNDMKKQSPKYIPREWMLAEAYTTAKNNNYEMISELYNLFKFPYDEQPEMEQKYYKLTPLNIVENQPGISFMSCSS